MSPEASQNPIFVALDTPSTEQALALAKAVRPHVGGVKVGLEFISAQGPDGIRAIVATDLPVFVDVKFHDIPNTVAGAVRSAVRMKPAILNVHAAGGRAMMAAAAKAAREEAAKLGLARPLVLGVTVLTSLDAGDLADIGVAGGTIEQVVRLASLAQGAGLDGVVCSGEEIEPLRQKLGSNFKLLVPGIRPAWAAAGDQKRILTPAEAVRRGADYLVIGRAITDAPDPVAAARRIADEIAPLAGP